MLLAGEAADALLGQVVLILKLLHGYFARFGHLVHGEDDVLAQCVELVGEFAQGDVVGAGVGGHLHTLEHQGVVCADKLVEAVVGGGIVGGRYVLVGHQGVFVAGGCQELAGHHHNLQLCLGVEQLLGYFTLDFQVVFAFRSDVYDTFVLLEVANLVVVGTNLAQQ